MFSPDLGSGFFPIPDPGFGFRGQKAPDPGSATLDLSYFCCSRSFSIPNETICRKLLCEHWLHHGLRHSGDSNQCFHRWWRWETFTMYYGYSFFFRIEVEYVTSKDVEKGALWSRDRYRYGTVLSPVPESTSQIVVCIRKDLFPIRMWPLRSLRIRFKNSR
jgi:hypothetical protein